MPRLLRALCVVYITATALHVGWIMAHEPFAFDAWNLAQKTGARPFSIGRFFDFWWSSYTHSNPRLGEAFTYLAYKLEYFAVIATPLAHLALAVAMFVLGTGRLPTRKGRDLALLVIAIGFMWFAMPQIGKTLFNRAYGANYLYGAAIQLWFLVPLRLVGDGRAGRGWTAAYFIAGVLAGLCNEHTGPTLCLATLVFAWWTHGRTQQRPTLAWAGAIGAITGFALIFFAPGQDERYDNLVERVGLVGKLLQRGLTGNLEIMRGLILAGAPLLSLIVLVMLFRNDDEERRRRALLGIGLAIIASIGITATIFVSPKLGPRFYLMPMALVLAGFIGLADIVLTTPRRLAPFVALAVVASIYAATKTVGLYGRLARDSDARIAQLEASRRGSVVTVDSFEQVEDSWWFLGDDFRDIKKRELIAGYFALRDVVLRGYDPAAPLGVSDVRLVPHAVAEPPRCVAEQGFELGWYRGLDVSTIHKAMSSAIDRLRTRSTGRLDRLDLTVQFVGDRPPLPRPTLLVGRWTPTKVETYFGSIKRKGRSRTREVVAPRELADAELYIYQVGGEARRLATPPTYVPWKTGVYWVLACRREECFVIAATRQAQ